MKRYVCIALNSAEARERCKKSGEDPGFAPYNAGDTLCFCTVVGSPSWPKGECEQKK
jgi:hypothetical protein